MKQEDVRYALSVAMNQLHELRDQFAMNATTDDLLDHAEIIRTNQRLQYGVAILPDLWRETARYMHADAMLRAKFKEMQ